MNKYPLAIFSDHTKVHFEHKTAARLARVSVAFIHECEKEELVKSRTMLHGIKGLCFADVCKLKRIRYLHEDMGLELEAVDFALQYRNRIKTMQLRLDEMEQSMRQKKQEHLYEILMLRQQLAQLSEGD